MVDISDDTNLVRRRAEITRVVRRRQWSDEEKGRIVTEAIDTHRHIFECKLDTASLRSSIVDGSMRYA